jgi:hypothetical protein
MLSVVGLSDADVAAVCEEARAKAGGAGTVCQLANMLFPQVGQARSARLPLRPPRRAIKGRHGAAHRPPPRRLPRRAA